jgi:DNA-binding NarL/FixJ family response regulator
VAIVEDNRLAREAITRLLNRVPGVRVVAAAPVLPDPSIRDAEPEVVLFDAAPQSLRCLQGAGEMRKELPTARVVVMDLPPGHEDLAELVDAGVSGFILKDASFEDFVSTVRSVAGGTDVLPARMTTTLFSQIVGRRNVRVRSAEIDDVHITRRESEVIELIGEGLGNKEIARRLNIATHTAKSPVRSVMKKLSLHTRLQIAAHSHRDALA